MKKCWEGHEPGQLVTYAVVDELRDGVAVFSIYRGKLSSVGGMPTVNRSKSTKVATTRMKTNRIPSTLRGIAHGWSTKKAPAFDFGR